MARTTDGGQSDLTAKLYATSNGAPTGNPLATATVPATRIGTSPTVVKVPLSHRGIVPGKLYAVVLSQQTPGNAVYVWTASGSTGLYGFGKIGPDGGWKDESSLGDAWLQVSGSLK